MSTPVCPNEGELDCQAILKGGATLKAMLFVNDVTPSATSVLADFTEPTFPGYTAGGQALVYGSPATNGTGQGAMTATKLTWTCSGGGAPEDVLGYVIYNDSTGKVWKAERMDTPATMADSGDKIELTDTMLQAGTIV